MSLHIALAQHIHQGQRGGPYGHMETDRRNLPSQHLALPGRRGICQIRRSDQQQVGCSGSHGIQAFSLFPGSDHVLIRIICDRALGNLPGSHLILFNGGQDKLAVQVLHIREQDTVIIFHLQGHLPDQEAFVTVIQIYGDILPFIFRGLPCRSAGCLTFILRQLSGCQSLSRGIRFTGIQGVICQRVRSVCFGTVRGGIPVFGYCIPFRRGFLFFRSPLRFRIISRLCRTLIDIFCFSRHLLRPAAVFCTLLSRTRSGGLLCFRSGQYRYGQGHGQKAGCDDCGCLFSDLHCGQSLSPLLRFASPYCRIMDLSPAGLCDADCFFHTFSNYIMISFPCRNVNSRKRGIYVNVSCFTLLVSYFFHKLVVIYAII